MPDVSYDREVFTVVTRTFINEDVFDQVIDLSIRSIPIFRRQPGLISLSQHLSHDKSHLMTYIQWENQQDHEACMVSPDFAEVNDEWQSLTTSGKIRFELSTYQNLISQ